MHTFERFVAERVWRRPFKDVVYLTPAITIDSSELDTLIRSIETVLAAV